MAKQRGPGFQKRAPRAKYRDVGLARVKYRDDDRAECSCGWVSPLYQRAKVREDSIDKHLSKRHDGRGIRT